MTKCGGLIKEKTSIKTTEGGFFVHYTTKGYHSDGPDWSHGYEFTKTNLYCPSCGSQTVYACEKLEEDNAGWQHLCTVCGYGFMGMDRPYLDMPKELIPTILAHWLVTTVEGECEDERTS